MLKINMKGNCYSLTIGHFQQRKEFLMLQTVS